MRFGDKEWLEKLSELYNFPSTFAFYVGSKGSLNSVDLKNVTISKLKYIDVSPAILENGERIALAKVSKCNDVNDYYNEVVELKKHWNK